MIAGLSFQVLTLLIFMGLVIDFFRSVNRRIGYMGKESALDAEFTALRRTAKFQWFLIALGFTTTCIFTRSVYRVAELSEGWTGHLIKTQSYFIGLEGGILLAGVLALNIFHPAVCLKADPPRTNPKSSASTSTA
jgi:hypothetical protein